MARKNFLIKIIAVLNISIIVFICLAFAGCGSSPDETVEDLTSEIGDNLTEEETSEESISEEETVEEPSSEEETVEEPPSEEEITTEPPVPEELTAEPTTQSPVINTVVLKKGDKGDYVKKLQIKLHTAGLYTGDIDGSFGPATESAVIKFQEAYNLTPNGVVESGTWAALDTASESAAEMPPVVTFLLKQGDTGDDIKDLQTKLRDTGFYTGDIDGSFGPMTESGVIKFQEAHNLDPDGTVNDETMKAINTAAESTSASEPQTEIQTEPQTEPPETTADESITAE